MISRRKKYALIWWIEDKQKDVIELSLIPKQSRKVDAVATLQWNDVKAKKTTQLKANPTRSVTTVAIWLFFGYWLSKGSKSVI